jgi:hypothetical protein
VELDTKYKKPIVIKNPLYRTIKPLELVKLYARLTIKQKNNIFNNSIFFKDSISSSRTIIEIDANQNKIENFQKYLVKINTNPRSRKNKLKEIKEKVYLLLIKKINLFLKRSKKINKTPRIRIDNVKIIEILFNKKKLLEK